MYKNKFISLIYYSDYDILTNEKEINMKILKMSYKNNYEKIIDLNCEELVKNNKFYYYENKFYYYIDDDNIYTNKFKKVNLIVFLEEVLLNYIKKNKLIK